MAERSKAPPGKKAAGVTLASLGGVTILNDLHFFEQGSFNLGSLVRMDLAGGPAGVTVHDGGVSLRCDPQWIVQPFALGAPNRLDTDRRVPADESTASEQLAARVEQVADALAQDAPSGSLLVIGSGDRHEAVGRNVDLAEQRAAIVRKSLEEGLAKAAPDAAPREVLLGNQALTSAPGNGAPDSPPLGLARLLFGAEEASARSVQVCVLQPRPHGVEAWGAAPAAPSFLEGFATAAILFALIAAIAYAVAAGRRARQTPAADKDAPETAARPGRFRYPNRGVNPPRRHPRGGAPR